MVRALAGMPEEQSSNPALFLFSFVRSKNRLYYEKRRKNLWTKSSRQLLVLQELYYQQLEVFVQLFTNYFPRESKDSVKTLSLYILV